MIRGQSAELDPVRRKDLVRELDLKILNDVSQYVVVGWSLIFPGWRVELEGDGRGTICTPTPSTSCTRGCG